ncbi:MAG: DUF262 domain-containing protein [Myxococcota bacterium]|nr:DUF262 domain-containing protein [Myxococcota bacterium]
MCEPPSELEPEEDEPFIREPFDPSKISIKLWQPTVDLLMKRILENELDLEPDFQRKAGLWKAGPKSRLIESLLVRIPLPAFYLDCTDEERLVVVDGLQRLTALKEFLVDKTLRLCELEFLGPELDGKTYDELPRAYRRRIEETQLAVFQIERGTPEEVKFNIFKRINTGGLPLSPQEIRHALNAGPARILLKRLAESPAFKEATAGGVPNERMADREMILRFFAFFLFDPLAPQTDSVGDFDLFLNKAFKTLNERVAMHSELESLCLRVLGDAFALFGNRAFRKWYHKDESRSPVNKALFEAWTVGLSRLDSADIERLRDRKEALQQGFRELMATPDFVAAVSASTGDPNKIRLRFGRIQRLIARTLANEQPSDLGDVVPSDLGGAK